MYRAAHKAMVRMDRTHLFLFKTSFVKEVQLFCSLCDGFVLIGIRSARRRFSKETLTLLNDRLCSTVS